MSDGLKAVSTGYIPRPLQLELHRKLKRFNAIVCHRRFGKTVFCINHMIDRGLRNPLKNPRYAYLAPLYGQAKRVAWDYLKMYTESIPGAVPNEADLRVDVPRPAPFSDTVRFTLLGADNPASLKGIYLDGVILDEYAEMNPAAWREVIRPTLSDRFGWAIFIGTPKGRNSFWEIYDRAERGEDPEWFGSMFKASQTGIIPPSELESARREMTEEEYDQEFECSFQAGLVGAYYSKEVARAEKDGRITSVPYVESLPVVPFFDLGVNDTTAIWFTQQVGKEKRLIDYQEQSGLGIPQWSKILKELPYNYDWLMLPHDASVRDMSTGKSRLETFRSNGFNRLRLVAKLTIEDGINAVRTIFSQCWFDKNKCHRGLEALRNYQRRWDPKQNVFMQTPLHNWASNGADAFRYFAVGERADRPDAAKLPDRADHEFNVIRRRYR